VTKPKPAVEKKISKAMKGHAAAVKVDPTPQKLAKILKRATGNGNNK
jgi:hypothetical protein